MRKNIRIIGILLTLLLLSMALVGCQNIFGSKTDIERVYGEWRYEKSSGAGINLTLNRGGTYIYQEFGTNGNILYSSTGKFSVTSTSLFLKDIDTDDDTRASQFAISMKNSTEEEDILELVPTFTKKYTFKRVISSKPNNAVAIKNGAEEKAVKLSIEGKWTSTDIGKIGITGNNII